MDLDGATGYVLPSDTEPTPVTPPLVALLPSLDPTTMGWQARDWYLGAHREALFDSNGNAGPVSIWVDGRIVGGWSSLAGGAVVTGLPEDVGARQGWPSRRRRRVSPPGWARYASCHASRRPTI